MEQLTFSPIDYGFEWTHDWYEWDSKAAHKAARRDRDNQAKELLAQGKTVRKFSLGKQLVSRGGIGSGHPHIELVISVYGLNYK